MSSSTVLSLFLYGLLGFGMLLFLFGIRFVNAAAASTDWPSVEGEIEAAYVRRWGSVAHPAFTRRQRDREVRYYNTVTYRYTVDGVPYTSDRFALGDGSRIDDEYDTEEEARAAMPYRTGERVEVFFDPEDPSSAVLDPGIGGSTYVPIGLGLLFAVTALLGLVALRGGAD